MGKKDKGVKSEREEKSSSFLREIFGMALMLFAVLSLICLITGGLLFYALGSAVQGFLLGVFGVYSFFVVLDLAHLGLRLVVGRSVLPSRIFKIYLVARIALVALFGILHLAVSLNVSSSVGEQISNAYNGGLKGFSYTSVFGVTGVLLIAPVSAIASVFGTYLLYSIVLLVCLIFIFKKPVLALFGKADFSRPEKKATKAHIDFNDDGIEDSLIGSDDGVPEKGYYGFFFNEDGFRKKSRKEMRSGEISETEFFGGDFSKKSDAIVNYPKDNKKVSERVDHSDDGKIDLRKMKDSVGDLGRNYPRNGGVSGVIPRDPVFINGEDEKTDKQNERVYVVPVSTEPSPARPTEKPEPVKPAPVVDGAKTARIADDKKDELSVVTSPFGEETREPTVGAYDDIVKDEFFGTEKPSFVVPDANFSSDTTDEKDEDKFTDFSSDGLRPRYTEIRSYEKNAEKDVFDDISDRDTEERSYRGGYGESENDRFDDDEEQTPSVAGSNVKRPRESYEDRRNSRPAITQQTSIFGRTKQKFTMPEDDDSEPIENMPANYGYTAPPISLLNDYKQDEQEAWEERNRQKWCAEMIVKVIKNKKNIDVRVENVVTGPAITRYDISIPEDVSPSDIFSTRQDLSFRLETGGELRMYSIPYTSLIGIEVANRFSRTVGLKETLLSDSYQKTFNKKGLHFVFGEDLLGQTISMNINAMPHLLVCGTTGSGKSVCLNTMLVSLLYRYSPAEFRLIIIDPKKVEFKNFKGIPHLVFNEILGLDNRALAVLEWAVNEMDRRYDFLADLGYKDIFEYNRSIEGSGEKKLPSILILIDEFAELIMAQPQNKKKIENYIGRLAQKARSAGISLICATQRASVNVITGSIKANIASRICFKTSSPVDSRVIIDEQGADKLLGNGDALYKTTEDSSLHRGQGAFISNDEVKKVVAFINEHNKCYYDNKLLEAINSVANEDEDDGSGKPVKGAAQRPDEVDEDYKKALRFAITRQVVSGSSLRTVLKIGYNKSAAIIMWMEKMGYISPILENRMRKVLFSREDYEETYGPFEEDDF